MTMHLEGPWLSTSGKKKGKQKFRNAAEARKARELAAEWERKQAEWAKLTPKFSKAKVAATVASPVVSKPHVRQTEKIQSRDTGWVPCTQGQQKVYTGTKVKGIGTMHKSNAVPIFSDDEAKEISSMRR